jgi:3-oxoacyl-[acyl-carrier-protein] synthase-3
MTRGARIIGWGSVLPEEVLGNDELSPQLNLPPGWIEDRSGVRQRHLGGTTAGLATAACRAALERASCDPADVDMLVLATMSPDQTCPASSSRVQHELGLTCGAFDVNAACTGFLYAMVSALGFVATGCERVLVVGSETMRRIVDWEDRDTAILFGDGAGAVLVEATPEGTPSAFLGWTLRSDGSLAELITCEVGGTMSMVGREVFRVAVRLLVDSVRATLEKTGLSPADISLLVPHQANIRILEQASSRLGIPMERVATVLEHSGNTSAASIPLALADAADAGRLQRGDHVLLAGFGAGMTSGSLLVRWDP